jgi:hypothetical protein
LDIQCPYFEGKRRSLKPLPELDETDKGREKDSSSLGGPVVITGK